MTERRFECASDRCSAGEQEGGRASRPSGVRLSAPPSDPVAQVRRDWDRFWLDHDRRFPPVRAGQPPIEPDPDAGDMLWVALAVAGVSLLIPLLIEVAKWLNP